jgi:hypothetical protein
MKVEEMEEWFKSLLNGLEIAINDNKPNSVFYKKNIKVIFELYQGSKKKYFYCDYDLVWSIFHNKYNLNYDETQAFIKSMVEEHLKLGAVTPFSLIRCMRILDRTALKNRRSKVKLLVTNIISLCIKFKTN